MERGGVWGSQDCQSRRGTVGKDVPADLDSAPRHLWLLCLTSIVLYNHITQGQVLYPADLRPCLPLLSKPFVPTKYIHLFFNLYLHPIEMASDTASASSHISNPTPSRGRGRGKSRGGFGKYLRARGRGGAGRPAEFHKRLVLEEEELIEVDLDSEEFKEHQRKYSRRQLVSNADRYEEPEPVLNSDGESSFFPLFPLWMRSLDKLNRSLCL